MNENVFMQSEMQSPEPRENESNGNNCNGHHSAIRAGGNGHYSGDGCDCAPTVSIDGYLWALVVVGIWIIWRFIPRLKRI